MIVRLPEDLERFVQSLIAAGRFASEDEAIAAAVCLLREQERATVPSHARPVTEEQFRQHLVNIGLMTPPDAGSADVDDTDDEPITINGEPLSETIIRERR